MNQEQPLTSYVQGILGAIKCLLDDGWVRRVDDPLPNDTMRERKAHVLTERGQRELNAEIKRLRKPIHVTQAHRANWRQHRIGKGANWIERSLRTADRADQAWRIAVL